MPLDEHDAAEESGFSENFFKQLTAEIFVQTFEKGRVIMKFVKIRERNEALDCAIYASAALELMNPNFEYLQEFYAHGGFLNVQESPRRPSSKGVSL